MPAARMISAPRNSGNDGTLAAGTYYVVSRVTDSAGTLTSTASPDNVTVTAPFIQLFGSGAAVPKPVAPGKKASAAVTVNNNGNIPAAGALPIALFARPAGTSGAEDVSLPTVVVKVRLKANGGRLGLKLKFVVPATLAAGRYSLVVQLDPGNSFDEPMLPAPTVGAATFAAT